MSSLQEGTSLNCSNFYTSDDVKHALLVRGISGILCFLLCCLALIVELLVLSQTKTNFLLRLFFHLTLSSTFFIGTFGGDLIHYFHYRPYGDSSDVRFCKALAFLAVYTATVTLIFICTIVFTLLRIMFKRAQIQVDRTVKKNTRIAEGIFVVVAYTSPLLVCWIPLLNDHYGNNQWSYCWFRNSSNDSPCDGNALVVEEILLIYVPNSIAALFSFICVSALIVWVIRLQCYTTLLRQKMRVFMKEMFLFIGFLGAYSTTWLIFLISSLVEKKDHPSYNFLLVKSLVNSVIVATIPSSFFFYLLARYCCPQKVRPARVKLFFFKLSSSNHIVTAGEYSNLQTGRYAERFIHNPSRISAASHTSDRDYNHLLTKSGETTAFIPDSSWGIIQ